MTESKLHSDPARRETPALTLIMPVLNEGVRVIPAISTLVFTARVPLKILVVYDKVQDNTIPVVNDLAKVFKNIELVRNEGSKVIGAIKTGIRKSKTDVIGVWVPYHVDPYGLVNKMYDLVKDKGCEVVSGNRFNRIKRLSRGSTIKKFFSRLGNYLLNRVIGVPFGDVTTSVKLYTREFLLDNEIQTEVSGGWALSTELALKAAIKGYRLGEVEFMPENTNLILGISNFRVFKQLDQYLKWLFWGYRNRKAIKRNYLDGSRFVRL